MKTFICLLRGINVGGKHLLPMKELRALLVSKGLYNVRTYIQSGNVVFQSEVEDATQLSEAVSATIQAKFGFKPQSLILTSEEFEEALAANPFPEAGSDPKSLHLYFMAASALNPNLAELEGLKKDNERFQLLDRVFYLHAPDGIGRSKVAAKIEKSLGQPVTARNWRSVTKIMILAQEISS
jgi:uncharacterized protein (DUF1697 family)